MLCALPAAYLGIEALRDRLTANPIERITHFTGYWAVTLLLVTLAVSPARRLTGWNGLIKLRRPIGLFAFFYVCLHFTTYLVLDHFFYWPTIVEDILDRPFITVGFLAFVLLLPLAFTSTKGWIRRLGKRWQTLHRLVYLAAGLGVLHYYWGQKADTRRPLIYAAVLAGLLAFRIPGLVRRRRSARTRSEGARPSRPVPDVSA
jgi:sulfoxide reductase heme-binding subunit YedZ